MKNREKAIAGFTEFLKELNNVQLAELIEETCYLDLTCNYCIHNDDGNCRTATDSCHNGIKKWLEQEEP